MDWMKLLQHALGGNRGFVGVSQYVQGKSDETLALRVAGFFRVDSWFLVRVLCFIRVVI